MYLYKGFLDKPLTLTLKFNRSHIQPKLPVVLNLAETALLLKNIPAPLSLPCSILYGSGLRLMEGAWDQVFHFECCNIYTFKLDFEYLHD